MAIIDDSRPPTTTNETEPPKATKPGAMAAPTTRPDHDDHGWALSCGEQRRQVRWG